MDQRGQNVAEFQRYQRSETVRPGGVSTGRAQAFQSLSNRLQSFASGQHAQADQEAAAQGERSGQALASGKISGVEMQNNDTIRGQAFNKGAIMAHAAQIQIEVRDKVTEFERTNQFDAAGFDAQVEGMKKGLLSEIHPMLQPHAEAEINDYVGRSRQTIQGNIYNQQIKENLATISKGADGMKEDILKAARTNDPAMLEKKLTQLTSLYDEGIKDHVLDPSKVQDQLNTIDEQIDEQIMLGHFYKLIEDGDLELAQTQLDSFNKGEDKETDKNLSLSPDTKDSVVSTIQTKINKAVTENKTALTLKTNKAKNDLADFNSVVDQGHLPNEQTLNFALENAKGTKHYADLVGLQKYTKLYTPFIAQTAEDQANALAMAKAKKNMSAVEVKIWKRLEKVHKETIEEAKTNGLELYYKQGVVTTPPPEINFDLLASTKIVDGKLVDKSKEEIAESHSMLAQQFAQNVVLSKDASAHYGVKVPPLTQTQAKALKHTIKEGSREEVIGMMSVITNGFGIDTPDAMAAIFEDDTTAYAAIGGQIVTKTIHSMDVATNMLKGIDKMKDFPTLIAKDFDIRASEIIGLAYEDFPDHRKLIVNGAKALYAQYLVEEGVYGGTGDSYVTDVDILAKAIKDSTGGFADMEADGTNLFGDDKYRIELPRDSRGKVQEAYQVEAWMENLTAADIDTMGGVQDWESAEVVKNINLGYVKLVSLGDSLYMVVTPGDRVLLDPETGDPFELDYSVGRHYASTLGVTHETITSEIANESKYVEEETTLTDVIDTVSDTVLDAANAITDATVGNLADLIYDEETMEEVNQNKDEYKENVRKKRYENRSKRKKKDNVKAKTLTIGKNDQQSYVGLAHFENEEEAIKYLKSKGKTDKGGVWYIKTKDGRIIK